MSDIQLNTWLAGAKFAENKRQRLAVYTRESTDDHSGKVVDYLSVKGESVSSIERILKIYREIKRAHDQQKDKSKDDEFDYTLMGAAIRKTSVSVDGMSFSVGGTSFSHDATRPDKVDSYIEGKIVLDSDGSGDMDVNVGVFLARLAYGVSGVPNRINFSNIDVSVHGGDGNDKIIGFNNSIITGGAGDDTLITYYESTIDGGDGNDIIEAGRNSTVTGGDGDDKIEVGPNSTASGGSGNDVIEGGHGSTLYGDDGDDVMWTHKWSTLYGGAGNDVLGGGGENRLVGGTGDDIVRLGVQSTAVFGYGDGHDTVYFKEYGGTVELGAGLRKADTTITRLSKSDFLIDFGNGRDKITLKMESHRQADDAITPAHTANMYNLRRYEGLEIKFSNGERISIVSEGAQQNVAQLTTLDLKV